MGSLPVSCIQELAPYLCSNVASEMLDVGLKTCESDSVIGWLES